MEHLLDERMSEWGYPLIWFLYEGDLLVTRLFYLRVNDKFRMFSKQNRTPKVSNILAIIQVYLVDICPQPLYEFCINSSTHRINFTLHCHCTVKYKQFIKLSYTENHITNKKDQWLWWRLDWRYINPHIEIVYQ